jgi:hypothetical protein
MTHRVIHYYPAVGVVGVQGPGGAIYLTDCPAVGVQRQSLVVTEVDGGAWLNRFPKENTIRLGDIIIELPQHNGMQPDGVLMMRTLQPGFYESSKTRTFAGLRYRHRMRMAVPEGEDGHDFWYALRQNSTVNLRRKIGEPEVHRKGPHQLNLFHHGNRVTREIVRTEVPTHLKLPKPGPRQPVYGPCEYGHPPEYEITLPSRDSFVMGYWKGEPGYAEEYKAFQLYDEIITVNGIDCRDISHHSNLAALFGWGKDTANSPKVVIRVWCWGEEILPTETQLPGYRLLRQQLHGPYLEDCPPEYEITMHRPFRREVVHLCDWMKTTSKTVLHGHKKPKPHRRAGYAQRNKLFRDNIEVIMMDGIDCSDKAYDHIILLLGKCMVDELVMDECVMDEWALTGYLNKHRMEKKVIRVRKHAEK